MDWAHRIQTQADLAYGPFPLQRLDLVVQIERVGEPVFNKPLDEPRPFLVWIHGGGWIQGDKSSQWHQIIPFLARGWHVANVNYRQGPGTAPLAVEDCLAALKWLDDNATALGLRYDRMVVGGASAGGHLALTTGLVYGDPAKRPGAFAGPAPDAVVNWYGITDIAAVASYLDTARPAGNYARNWAGARDMQSLSAEWSPVALVSAGSPPVLTLHGDNDTVVPHAQAVALHARLAALDVKERLVTLPGGNHGGFTDAQYQEAFSAVFDFLG